MTAKKVGTAKPDPAAELWGVEQKPDRFMMNPRLVALRPDVKALKAAYTKHIEKKIPSRRRLDEREEHFQRQKDLKEEFRKLVEQIYAETLRESFSFPLPLRKDKDADHNSDWRYCLYQGIIYQFDRPGYGSEQMIEQITALQNRQTQKKNA